MVHSGSQLYNASCSSHRDLSQERNAAMCWAMAAILQLMDSQLSHPTALWTTGKMCQRTFESGEPRHATPAVASDCEIHGSLNRWQQCTPPLHTSPFLPNLLQQQQPVMFNIASFIHLVTAERTRHTTQAPTPGQT